MLLKMGEGSWESTKSAYLRADMFAVKAAKAVVKPMMTTQSARNVELPITPSTCLPSAMSWACTAVLGMLVKNVSNPF
jgi:hypothetical protein